MKPEILCESCGMPIAHGQYCTHCTDDHGRLQSFDERLAALSKYILDSGQTESRAAARKLALDAMARMPAWNDHPRLVAARRPEDSSS